MYINHNLSATNAENDMAVSTIKKEIKTVKKTIKLTELQWNTSYSGMKYAVAASVNDAHEILAITVEDFSSLSASLSYHLYSATDTSVSIMANTDAFGGGAELQIKIVYR